MKIVKTENEKTLQRIAIFLIGSGFVVFLLGLVGKNYATAFFGSAFSILSFVCLLCIDSRRIFLAKVLWGTVSPLLLFLSPVFFPIARPILIVTYGYLYIGGMLFTSYSFHDKSEKKVMWLSIALFFTGLMFYDRVIIDHNFLNDSAIAFITNDYTYFKITQAIHFISLLWLVIVFHANKTIIEKKLSGHSIKMQGFNNDLISISKNKLTNSGDLLESLKEILLSSCRALDISRISVWEYVAKENCIKLIVGYDMPKNEFTYSATLNKDLYPTYFEHLLTEKIIAAKDAVNDLKTSEFTESYLNPLGIKSMMDSPFFIDGEFKGIICCEEQRDYRDWDDIDKLFSVGISNLISISYYCTMRKEQFELLVKASEELSNRTNLLEQINGKILTINEGLTTELIDKEQGIKELQDFIDDLSHRNAHHIRGPLCRIIGLVRLYQIDGDTDNRRLYIQYMDESAREMDNILKEVSQLLDKNWGK